MGYELLHHVVSVRDFEGPVQIPAQFGTARNPAKLPICWTRVAVSFSPPPSFPTPRSWRASMPTRTEKSCVQDRVEKLLMFGRVVQLLSDALTRRLVEPEQAQLAAADNRIAQPQHVHEAPSEDADDERTG